MQLFFFAVRRIAMALLCALVFAPTTPAINISISYQFDTLNFFGSQARRDALEAAADVFRVFTDSLAAISPGTVHNPGTVGEFTDTWTATFEHPGSAGQTSVTDLGIPANTVVIYAGGKNLSGTTLGFGGPGGYSVNGISSFVNAVSTRGQSNTTGATPTDFARWGGGITFDTHEPNNQPRVWHTDLNSLPAPGAVDLYTVAIHELGHLFGFALGSAQQPLSFQTYLNASSHLFSGPKAVQVYGGSVSTDPDGSAHWNPNVMSTTSSGSTQLAIMGPAIAPGVRRNFTLLDYAAMKDIGWQVPQSIFDAPVPGDYDGNRIVNAADYAVWRKTYGSTSSLAADGNQSGRVDAADYALWRDHLGTTGGSGSIVSAIPEPSGIVIAGWLVGGLVFHFAIRRRK